MTAKEQSELLHRVEMLECATARLKKVYAFIEAHHQPTCPVCGIEWVLHSDQVCPNGIAAPNLPLHFSNLQSQTNPL
jgi:hypothetical protein